MPIRKVTDPALLQQLNGPQMVAPNPMFPGQMQGQGLNNTGQSLTNQRTAAELPYVAPKAAAQTREAQVNAGVAAATAPADIATKTANARRTAAEATAAEANTATTGGAGAEQAKSGSFYTRATRANQLYAEGQYDLTGKGQPTIGREALKTVLPDSWVNANTSPERQAAEALQEDFIRASLRYESGANIPETEIAGQRKIYFPQPGDGPETVALKARLRQNAIDGLRVAAGPSAPVLDATHGSTDNGITQSNALPQLFGNQAAGTQAPATTTLGDVANLVPGRLGSHQRKTLNEADPETSAAEDRLLRMGRPTGEIVAFAKERGYETSPQDIAKFDDWRKFLKRHPDYKGGMFNVSKPRPMSIGETLSGSPVGAAGSSMGTAATLGFNDEMAGVINKIEGGDYTEGRDAYNAKKELLADAHPYADFAGTALGASGTMGAISKVGRFAKLGDLLKPATRYGRSEAEAITKGLTRANTLGDIVYGSGYGAGENNQDRTLGAIEGGASAYAGNLAGRGAANTLGGLVSPTGGKLAKLYEMGVRPSIGQRVGGVVNSAEERLQSIPILGDAIAGTRQRARDQYQVGLFNDALGEIGAQLPKGMKPGHDPHRFAQDAFAKAYDAAESGMTALPDSQFISDVAQLHKSVMNLRPESQAIFDNIWQGSVERRAATGSLTGEGYKKAMSELSKKTAAIRKNPMGDFELADTFDEAMGALRGSATRNSPPEAVAALNAADRGYAKMVRIEDASRRQGGDAATFSPLQYNAAVKNTSGGIRNRGYLAGDALNSDIAAKGLQLGDVVANSRSVDRLLPMMFATGAGYVSPPAAGAMGVLAALNAPGVRNLTTALMAPRGGKARTVADLIRKQSPTLGTIGSGLGIGLLPPQ